MGKLTSATSDTHARTGRTGTIEKRGREILAEVELKKKKKEIHTEKEKISPELGNIENRSKT